MLISMAKRIEDYLSGSPASNYSKEKEKEMEKKKEKNDPNELGKITVKSGFNAYQVAARKTAIYPETAKVVYPALGLAGETGEVCEKIKKVIRDGNGEFTDERRQEIAKEIGDVMWYMAALASDLGLSLGDVAVMNIEKLLSRMERGKLHGDGDNR